MYMAQNLVNLCGHGIYLVLFLRQSLPLPVDGRYIFEPIAIESLDVFSTSARQLLADLGRRISQISGEARESGYLFQRCSVLVQRFNAILLHDSLPAPDCTD